MFKSKIALFAGAGMAVLMAAPAAWAQETPEAEASEVTGIIVTAQKREERLQDVPVAISVVGNEQLERQNISNIDQLKLVVPSFESNAFGVSIRGVGTATFSTSIEVSVSTVLDGVALGRPEMALGSFYDLSRVEVLRGPQGMLFGKNASAGVVSLTTQSPHLSTFEALGNFNFGTDGYVKSDATVNIPLGDKAAIRFGGYVNQADGVIHNRFDGRDFNGNDEKGGRLKFLWSPTDNLDILLTADYGKQNQSVTWSPYKLNPLSPLNAVYAACGVKASPDNTDLCIDGPQSKDRENYGFTGQVDWRLGDFTLTSITAARRDIDKSAGDSDSRPTNILNENISDQDIRQFSQEVRLASPTGQLVDYVAGLYYFNLKTEQTTSQTGTFGLPFVPPIVNQTITNLAETESIAAFGQASVHLGDKLTLLAGGRFTHDKVTLDFNQFNRPGTFPLAAPVSFKGKTEEDNFSWRVGAQYKITPVTMAYFTVARGYKGPGFNQTAVSPATAGDQLVNPEYPMSYELGLKTALPGNILLNLAIFDTKFEDYQAQILDNSVTPAVFRTTNAGDLKTRGFEADVVAAPFTGMLITAGVTYLDAKYGNFAPISCYPGQTPAQGCVVFAPGQSGYDASGQRLANTAKWKYAIAGRYEHPLSDGLKVFVQADYSWRSETNASANKDPNTVIGSYGILSGAFGIASEDDKWRLSLWGKNLTDERFPSALFGTPFGVPGDYSQVLTSDAFSRFGVALNVRY